MSSSWRWQDSPLPQRATPTSRLFRSNSVTPLRILFNEEKHQTPSKNFDLMLYFQHQSQSSPYLPFVERAVARCNYSFHIREEDKIEFVKTLLKLDKLRYDSANHYFSESIFSNSNSNTANTFALFSIEPSYLKHYKLVKIGYFLKDTDAATVGNIELCYRDTTCANDREICINFHLRKDQGFIQGTAIQQVNRFIRVVSQTILSLDCILLQEILSINPYQNWSSQIKDKNNSEYFPVINPVKGSVKTFLFFARGLFAEQEDCFSQLSLDVEEDKNKFAKLKDDFDKLIRDMPEFAGDKIDPRYEKMNTQWRISIDTLVSRMTKLLLDRNSILDDLSAKPQQTIK